MTSTESREQRRSLGLELNVFSAALLALFATGVVWLVVRANARRDERAGAESHEACDETSHRMPQLSKVMEADSKHHRKEQAMRSSFTTNILALLAGGFVVVASQAFAAATTGWITFGVAIGILGMTAVAQLDRSRGRLQRGFDALIGLLSIWSAVASVVFSGSALTWLSLGDLLGVAVLACAGLIGHELSTEHAVQRLSSRELGSEPAVKAA